jgi:hypothetical protein
MSIINKSLVGVGAITLLWLSGAIEFMPKLMADIGQWDGVETINRIMQAGGRAIASQLDKKLGNAKPLSADQNVKLGSQICKDKTTTPNARLSLKMYERHLQAVELKVRSPLRDKNPDVFCEWHENKWSPLTKIQKLVYVPEWEAAKSKALIVDQDSTDSKIIDLTSDGQQSKP